MVRMDNLSAVIMTSRVFTGSSNGFHWIYPASFISSPGGGGMDRIPTAESIGIGWRNESESGGAFNRNPVADCVGIRTLAGLPLECVFRSGCDDQSSRFYPIFTTLEA